MYYNYNYRGYPNNDNRFVFPFLLGGLAGGALVGVTRPRPVYVNSPQPNYSYRPYPQYPPYFYGPSGYYNYSSGGYY